jgi:hypothetical protein
VTSGCGARRVTSFLELAIWPIANWVLGMLVHVSDARFTSGLPMVLLHGLLHRCCGSLQWPTVASHWKRPKQHRQPMRRIIRTAPETRTIGCPGVYEAQPQGPFAPLPMPADWLFVSCRARTSAAP